MAGTDPLDANSLLRIDSLYVDAAGDVVVRWQSVDNMIYSIELSTNLGSWLPVLTELPATPPMNVSTISVDAASAPQMFFRVIVK